MRAQFNGSYELAAIPFAPIPVSLCDEGDQLDQAVA
jgi:hypothetical protein